MFFKKNKSNDDADQMVDTQSIPTAEADQVTNPDNDAFDEEALREALSTWCADREIDDALNAKIMETILAIRHSLAAGDDTPTLFDLARKAADYDDAIARAASDGELKGRNLAIEELANGEPQDDGMPHFSSYAYNSSRELPSIFRLAQDAL